MVKFSNRGWLLILAAPLSIAIMLAIYAMPQATVMGTDKDFLAGMAIGVGVGVALLALKFGRPSKGVDEPGGSASAGALAERCVRLRTRAALASVLLFLTSQGLMHVANTEHAEGGAVYGAVWVVWCLAMVVFLATGGGLFMSAGVRRLMNDEVSNANRAVGRSAALYAMLASALGVYIVNLLTPVSVDDAVHGMLTIGLSAGMLYYTWLEHRADRAG